MAIFTSGNSNISKNSHGFCRMVNGLIIQWGLGGAYNSEPSDSYETTINLPISFTTHNYTVVGAEALGDDWKSYTMKIGCSPISVSNFKLRYTRTNNAVGTMYRNTVRWIAIGY